MNEILKKNILSCKNITLDNENKQGDNDILEWEESVKFCNVRPTKWFGHAERMQNQRIPKQPAEKKEEDRVKDGKTMLRNAGIQLQ
jgi:hypothetical protein